MSEFFSQLAATVMSAWLMLTGTIVNEPTTVSGHAASLQLAIDEKGAEIENEYVSLFDVISASLEKLKETITASSSESAITKELEEEIEVEEAPDNLGQAIVNIICIQKTDTFKRTASGTGFIINEAGVILTNAHVAQFILLEQAEGVGTTVCQARVGTETKTAYEIDLLYISPNWLLENADFVNTGSPSGTGENDFALLHITEPLNGYEIPDKFPHLPPSTSPLSKDTVGNTVILVGYPTSESSVGTRTVATTSIQYLYTFNSGYADIMSLAASPLGHQGASGGPVIDNFGRSIAVITTKDPNSTALNAITISHIDRTLQAETGYDLINTISGDLVARAKLYSETVAPILSEILANEAADTSTLLPE